MHQYDVLILGSGLAALTTALKLADRRRVAIVTKRQMTDGASDWAQGGIAAAVDSGDSIEAHVHDTLVAGAGNQGVVHMRLDRVAAVHRGGNAALRPVAGTVGHLALGDDGDAAPVGQLERGGQRGEAAAEDEDVVLVHGVAG